MMVRVHRGTREIGGTCIEVEAAGDRVVLDLGLPLNAQIPDSVPLPDIPGLTTADPRLKAIILSHSHRDHWA